MVELRVGVIGGSGFIGSHLVDKLVEGGHEVVVFDIKKPHRDDVEHIYIDITDESNTIVALTGEYDAIYHLAAMADVNDVYKNPVQSVRVNIEGVANVLEAARRNDIKRIILASTIWVYMLAASNNEIVDENTSLDVSKCNHVYTTTKVAAELLCINYHPDSD